MGRDKILGISTYDVVSMKFSNFALDSFAWRACRACSFSPNFWRLMSWKHPTISSSSFSSEISGWIEIKIQQGSCVDSEPSILCPLAVHVFLSRSSQFLEIMSIQTKTQSISWKNAYWCFFVSITFLNFSCPISMYSSSISAPHASLSSMSAYWRSGSRIFHHASFR